MKKNILLVLSSTLVGLLVIELLTGYVLFQERSRFSTALAAFFYGRLQAIDSVTLSPPSIAPANIQPNPFMSYETDYTKIWMRYHPFIDYSGVHIMLDPKKGLQYPDLDYFGFRNKHPLTYFSKDYDFLVVISGGSETAGFYHSVTIAEHLEQILGESGELRGARVRVLNLAMNSYSVANEINAFVQLAFHLRPNVVISHSGWNDMVYGSLAPSPFRQLGLNFMHPMLNWMSRLYDLKVSEPAPWRINNDDLDRVLYGYLANIDKYRRIAESDGATFIAGLQGYRRIPATEEYAQVAQSLMAKLERRTGQGDFIVFGDDPNIRFVDDVHTSPESAKRIALRYADQIRDAIRRGIIRAGR